MANDIITDIHLKHLQAQPFYHRPYPEFLDNGDGAFFDGYLPGGVDSGTRMGGHVRKHPLVITLDEAKEAFTRLLECDGWPLAILNGWEFDDAYGDVAALSFFPEAKLTLKGARVIRAYDASGHRTRNDSWVLVKTRRGVKDGAQPPIDYLEDDLLYSMDNLPRNLEAEWDDFLFEQDIFEVLELCIARPSGKVASPIRMMIGNMWPSRRIHTPGGMDLWEIPPHTESRICAVPLDLEYTKKLVSFIVPTDLPRSQSTSMNEVPGQRRFSPMKITSGHAMGI